MVDPVVNKETAKFIPVARPSIGEAEQESVANVMRSGQLTSADNVKAFERVFAEAHGKKFGVAVNSGTSALHLAIAALYVKPESIVLCPAMTMVAVANAIRYCGAHPRFIDSEPVTGNMDANEASRRLSVTFPAIICPHLYGVPVSRISCLPADRTIEDCAEAHYATYPDGKPVGSYGTLAVFSFYANKIITTGEGGMVLTDDETIANRLRNLRAHAFTPGNHFHHQELAYGYRMTDTAAAIGLVQHSRRNEFLSRRQQIAERYMRNLAACSWLTWQPHPPGSVWWVFPILLHKAPHSPINTHQLRHSLAESGIETRTWFNPLNKQPHLSSFRNGHNETPVADDLHDRGIYLPLYPSLTDSEIDYVCESVIAAGKPKPASCGAGGSGSGTSGESVSGEPASESDSASLSAV